MDSRNGNVTKLKLTEDMRCIERTEAGKFRCTIRRNKKYVSNKVFDTAAEAREIRDDLEREMKVSISPGGITVREWGDLLLRRQNGVRVNARVRTAMRNLRSHFNAHIKDSPLGDLPVRAVATNDIKKFVKWLDRRSTQHAYGDRPVDVLSAHTRRRVLTSLRKLFQAAVEDEDGVCRCRVNPVGTVSIPLSGDRRALKRVPKEVPLLVTEQQTVIGAYGDSVERELPVIAIWTGIRLGEMWNLELKDVHLDEVDPTDPTGATKRHYIDVRYGSEGHLPPKNGKPRKVPLFGEGLQAMQRWLSILPTYAPINPDGLVFPLPQTRTSKGKIKARGGHRRGTSKVPRSWKKLQRAKVLGEHRRFWWHALRHTCATALLCGWWGRRWQLIEVAEFLGHTSTEVTEMYAHLLDSALLDVAAETQVAFEQKHTSRSEKKSRDEPAPEVQSALETLKTAARVAVEEGNWSLVQSLGSLIEAQAPKGATASERAPKTPAPADSTAPVSPPRAVPRTGRRGGSGRRSTPHRPSSPLGAEGDTEGPRPAWDETQLALPVPGQTRGRSPGLSPETFALTLGAHGMPRSAAPPAVGSTSGPGVVQTTSGVGSALVTRSTSTARTRRGAHAQETAVSPPVRKSCPHSAHETNNHEQYRDVSSIERRSTEPKVESSNLSGRAEQDQRVSQFSTDENGQQMGRGVAQETPDDGQALIDPLVPGAAETASAGHAGQAQRLIQAVASGRQDAWRVAEDLAMALLMSKADKRHHEAARLVLKDRDLRIPRALELAVKLLGPAPKVKPSPKKR